MAKRPQFGFSTICLLALFLLSFPQALATSWSEIQRTREFKEAKKQLADYLPDLAEPKIQKLLERPKLTPKAKSSLLTLLGEAQVRQALHSQNPDREKLLTEAIATLSDPILAEFSPSHLWRSRALTNLGRLQEAIAELKRIDRRSMRAQADLEMATLMAALGNFPEARERLEPLSKKPDQAVQQQANLQLISVALQEKNHEEASQRIAKFTPADAREEALKKFLTGRLQLAQGERLLAVGSFQELQSNPSLSQSLPSDLFLEIPLAIADSLALRDGEDSAVAELLQTLEEQPEYPRLEEIFARLTAWLPKIEADKLTAKLSEWIPRDQPDDNKSDNEDGETRTLPSASLYALQFLITQHLRSEDPDRHLLGQQLIKLLQKYAQPDSPILGKTLTELALFQIQNKQLEEAKVTLDLVLQQSPPAALKSYLTSLLGHLNFQKETLDESSKAFLEAAKIAQQIQDGDRANLYHLNAGIALLTAHQSEELETIISKLEAPEDRSFLLLERGLYLATQRDPTARELLIHFLTQFPESPRYQEAGLTLAENAAFVQPRDPALALAQANPLSFKLESQTSLAARRILVLLATDAGHEEAVDFLSRFTGHPLSPKILFQLGQSYRLGQEKEVGLAYQTFERFLSDYPDHEIAEAARYFSALSALSSDTESAQQKAIMRFRELIESNGPFASEAVIGLADLLINQNRNEQALLEITFALEKMKPSSSVRRRLFIMAADASGQLQNYSQVLKYYEQLLALEDLPAATRNRASFQRGQTLERMGLESEALQQYLSVIDRRNDLEQADELEWRYYHKCGIEGALPLLERMGRYQAAVEVAEKMAQSGSPRAQDAQDAADRITLERRIWKKR